MPRAKLKLPFDPKLAIIETYGAMYRIGVEGQWVEFIQFTDDSDLPVRPSRKEILKTIAGLHLKKMQTPPEGPLPTAEVLAMYDNADPHLILKLRDVQTALGLSDAELVEDLQAGRLIAQVKPADHGDYERGMRELRALPMKDRLDIAWVNAADLKSWLTARAGINPSIH